MADWGAILAGVGGGLEGGADAYHAIEQRRRLEEEAEARRQEREEALELRRQEIARLTQRQTAADEAAATEAAGASLDRTRAVYGTDQNLPGSVAGLAARAGRGNEVATTMTPPSASDLARSALAMSPAGPMALPSAASRFVPTAAERAQRQQADEVLRRIEALRPQNPAAAAALETGMATGKVPTLGVDAHTPPVDPIQAIVDREKALLPVKAQEIEQRERIEAKFRPPPAGAGPRKDDPALPNGVRAYLGKLVGDYQGNRAGAERELQSAMPSLIQAHPSLDLVAVQRQFDAVFPKPAAGGLDLGLPPAAPPAAPARTAPAGPPPASPTAPPRAAAGGRTVTGQQLQAIAAKRGTTVDQERRRAESEGFVVR